MSLPSTSSKEKSPWDTLSTVPVSGLRPVIAARVGKIITHIVDENTVLYPVTDNSIQAGSVLLALRRAQGTPKGEVSRRIEAIHFLFDRFCMGEGLLPSSEATALGKISKHAEALTQDVELLGGSVEASYSLGGVKTILNGLIRERLKLHANEVTSQITSAGRPLWVVGAIEGQDVYAAPLVAVAPADDLSLLHLQPVVSLPDGSAGLLPDAITLLDTYPLHTAISTPIG